MSDGRDQGGGGMAPPGPPPPLDIVTSTAPMTKAPSNTPMKADPRATQMSLVAPTAVEPPLAPSSVAARPLPAADDGTSTEKMLRPVAQDEINGAALADATTRDAPGLREAQLRDAQLHEASAHGGHAGQSGPPRRAVPPTMMSPVVAAPRPGESPPIAPEDAVVDVGAPAHAYGPHPGAPPGYGGQGGRIHHGGSSHLHHAQGPRSGASTKTMVLLVVGIAGGVILLAAIAVGAFVFARRGSAEAPRPTLGAPAPLETASSGKPPPTPAATAPVVQPAPRATATTPTTTPAGRTRAK